MEQMNYKLWCAVALLISAGSLSVMAQSSEMYSGDVNYTGDYGGYHSYSAENDTYTINGSGSDVWGTSDQFYYVYKMQEVDQDFDYIVKINNFDGSANSWMKAGLMVRECGWESYDESGNMNGFSQFGDSRYFSIASQKANGAEEKRWTCQWRADQGANVDDNSSWRLGAFSYPSWQRIRRMGDTYISYISTDGENWTQVYSLDTSVPSYDDAGAPLWLTPLGSSDSGYNLSVGMWVTSHNTGSSDAQAIFEGFKPYPQEPVDIVDIPESVEVYAGRDAIISATVSGYDPISYEWVKDGIVLESGSTYSKTITFNIPAAEPNDGGEYTLRVSNQVNGTETNDSANFTLDVTTDDDPPTITSISVLKKTIGITFNEPISPETATVAANYSVSGKTVQSVTQTDNSRVVLTLNSDISIGGNAEVTVKNVADLSGNIIAADTVVTAEAEFLLANTGKPFVAGTGELLGGDKFRLNNQGLFDWDKYDEDTLLCKNLTGDFDIRIRVLNQSPATFDARAGLEIRESLDQGSQTNHSRYVAIHHRPLEQMDWDATNSVYTAPVPNMDGFSDYRYILRHIHRAETGGDTSEYASNVDSIPMPDGSTVHPFELAGNMWIRLNRNGDTISAYYSIDQLTWTKTGEKVLKDLNQTLYAGVHYAIEGRNFAEDSTNLPQSLTNEFKNPTVKFYANFIDWEESYLKPVSITTQPPTSVSVEGPNPLTIKIVADGDPLTYQWYKDGVAIEGADQATLTLPYTAASDSGSYTCEVMNFGHGAADKGTSVMSNPTVVTVSADTTLPELVASGFDLDVLLPFLQFSKGMDIDSLLDFSNYQLTDLDGNPIAITGVNINEDATYVTLESDYFLEGGEFLLNVNGLVDRSGNPLTVDEVIEITILQEYPIYLEYYENDDSLTSIAPLMAAVQSGAYSTRREENNNGMTIPRDIGDYYGVFFSGMILPPETGNYRFAISSDDDSRFFLSTNSTPDGLSETAIASVNGSVGYGDYDAQSNQQSSNIYLEAGVPYYFEVYFVERSGGDFLTIAWSLPSQGPSAIADNTAAISSEYVKWIIAPHRTVLEVLDQPDATVNVYENSIFSLDIDLNYSSDMGPLNKPLCTWYMKSDYTNGEWVPITQDLLGESISGYNSPSLKFNGATSLHSGLYRMEATLLDRVVESQEITLNVTSDTEAPVATATGSNTMEEIVVTFSESVFGAEEPSNYQVDGLTILSVTPFYDGSGLTKAILQTTRQDEGKVYNITMNNIYDMAGNPVANKTSFTSFVWVPGYALFEAFSATSSYELLGEVIDWNIHNHNYMVPPQAGKVTEITSTTFNLDNYVAKISGYLCPQVSGTYEFAGSSDDSFKAFLSTDESPLNLDRANPIAWQNSNTDARIYNYTPGSGAVTEMGGRQVALEAGKRYYYNINLQEGTGGDFVAMTWRLLPEPMQANGTEPILKGNLIGMYVDPTTANITILEQTEEVNATEGDFVTLEVIAQTDNPYNAPIEYQWYMDGAPIEGATQSTYTLVALQEYVGKIAYCELSIPGNTTRSADIPFKSVESNATPVQPISVVGVGNVEVTFDSPVDEESATDPANYSIEGGTVLSAQLIDDLTVSLQIEAYSEATVSVTVSNVKNLSGIPMPEPVTVVGYYCPLSETILAPNGVLGFAVPEDNDVIQLYNGGGDIWNAAEDSCLYLYEPIEGDFDVVLCVESIENNHEWTKLGLSFRANLEASSPHVAMLATPTRVQAIQRPYPPSGATTVSTDENWPRLSETNGTTTITMAGSINHNSETYPTQWLRLKREGTTFTAYRSLNGMYWTLIQTGDFTSVPGNTQYQMPDSGYIGIVYSAQDKVNLRHATVSGYNTAYQEPPLPTPDPSEYSFANIGQEENGAVGFYDYDSELGIYEIWGNGSDIWGTADHFSYLYMPVPEGDFTFTAKVLDYIASTDGWSKAGLQVREGDANGNHNEASRYFASTIQRENSPSNSMYRTQWRDSFGSNVQTAFETGLLSYPHWQRIERQGNLYISSISLDGQRWTEINSQDTSAWVGGPLGSTLPLYIGMWMTSHNTTSTDGVVRFEHPTLIASSNLFLEYSLEGDILTLSWDAAENAVLEVSSQADADQWEILEAELVGDTMQVQIQITADSPAEFYRLVKE